MCIKIIGEKTLEFNPYESLENQLLEAKEIFVKYDSSEQNKIDSFIDQMEKLCQSGITCNAEIKVDGNNCLEGFRVERKIDRIKKALDTNEFIKSIARFHATTDSKLSEIQNICLRKLDET